MSEAFVFIGDPGPSAPLLLRRLNATGFMPKRCQVSPELLKELAAIEPAAVVFDASVQGRKQLVAGLRENSALAVVPFLARVSAVEAWSLEEVFNDGMDDYIVDGADEQFVALLAALKHDESLSGVRAPVGQVVLAHPERLERVRVATLLRRNGFDTYFAATTEDLQRCLEKLEPRAVIASTGLPGEPLLDVLQAYAAKTDSPAKWIVMSPLDEIEALAPLLPEQVECKIFEEGSDVAGLTFLMNEMLSPPPAGVRRSPRLLFGAPAKFINEGGSVTFNGYSFNVNIGGLYVRTLSPFPLQTRIEVSFQPPFGRGRVVAVAQVCWVKRWGDTAGAASPPGMGIQFLEMWKADQAGFEAGYAELLDRSQSASSAPSRLPGGIV